MFVNHVHEIKNEKKEENPYETAIDICKQLKEKIIYSISELDKIKTILNIN